jgi:glutathione S-transferase
MMRLVVANLNYSSWSMRAYLGLTVARADFKLYDVGLKTKEGWKERIYQFSGAGKVPILVEGPSSIHEALAILETANERYPEAKLWPDDPQRRARGRALSSEMATGFLELRSKMPTNLRGRAASRPRSEALDAEVSRVLDIFEASLSTTMGDFLLGDFSIADCMYFPVLLRFRTFQVELPPRVARYAEVMFGHPAVKQLEEIALGTEPIAEYDAFLK